jgi:alkylation response protein AidB-like acyl-CoA dehydrogenase
MFLLTDEAKIFQDTMRRMTEEKVKPRAAEIDRKGEYPWDMKQLFCEAQLMGLGVPEQYGGTGGSHLFLCIAVEEVARACTASSIILQVQSLGSMPIVLAGNDGQKERYLPKLTSGEYIASFGLTEPNAGSDSAAIQTKAVLKGEKYIISGSKHFISNGPVSDIITLFAMTDSSKGVKGISAFIVETDTPGYARGRIEETMGIRGAPVCEIHLEDCEVPKENLLGSEGQGFSIAMRTLDTSRPVIASQAVGIAQGALDAAIEYSKTRVQFGRPIAKFQGLRWMLADMAAQIEAARMLAYHAASLVDEGASKKTFMSACSKLIATDTAMRVTTDAVQIAGGYGYCLDYPFERYMRDAKVTQIYEGTNQIQKLVIANELFR